MSISPFVRAAGVVVQHVTTALGHGERAAELAEKAGVQNAGKAAEVLSKVNTAADVAKSVAAGSAAVASATTIGVAATSGAGIAAGLAGAGGIIGAGMAAGPAVLAGGPAALASMLLNRTVFKKASDLPQEEDAARSAARKATSLGATAGVAGVGAGVVAGGASGAAIMSTLATVGSVVGGGAQVGTGLLVAAPVVGAGGAGLAIYKIWGGGKKHSSSVDTQSEAADTETACQPCSETTSAACGSTVMLRG